MNALGAVLEAVLEGVPNSLEPRTVLVAGSGPRKMDQWDKEGFKTVYLDIEPRNNPDIVANMTDLGNIGPFNVIYCCHALEHLYPHEVNVALSEFRRVLKPGGAAVVIVPDLEDVKPNDEILEYCEGCPITGLQMFYGDHRYIKDFPYMAHHCGFIAETLKYALDAAGYEKTITTRESNHNLVGIGVKVA